MEKYEIYILKHKIYNIGQVLYNPKIKRIGSYILEQLYNKDEIDYYQKIFDNFDNYEHFNSIEEIPIPKNYLKLFFNIDYMLISKHEKLLFKKEADKIFHDLKKDNPKGSYYMNDFDEKFIFTDKSEYNFLKRKIFLNKDND